MTIIRSVKGRLPMYFGEYDSARIYGKKNRCSLYGCEWESLIEDNIHAPAKIIEGEIVVNVQYWKLVSGVLEAYKFRDLGVITNSEIDSIVN